jgi:nicotinamide mononucleotide (NMN) deamidase PncC
MADKSFSVAIKGFKKDTMDAVSAVFRKTALDLAKGAAQKTRVDTGLARGNWQLGVGVKPPGAVETATKAASGPVGHFIAQLSDFDPRRKRRSTSSTTSTTSFTSSSARTRALGTKWWPGPLRSSWLSC